MSGKRTTGSEKLRRMAEHLLSQEAPELAGMTAADLANLVHELEVHELQVELHNEELRRVEEELRQERDRLTRILDGMPDAVFIVDGQYQIRYANPVVEADFGKAEGRLCYRYFHRRRTPCPWCNTADVLTGKTLRGELNRTRSGKTYDAIASPVLWGGPVCKLVILRDITERKSIEENLARYRERLEDMVQERTERLEELVEKLEKEIAVRREAEERSRALSQRIIKIQEDERRNIAHEMHDVLGQTLTLLKLSIYKAKHSPLRAVRGIMDEADGLLDEMIAEVREISAGLRPSVLDDIGLVAALAQHIVRLTAKTGIQVSFEHAGIKGRASPDVEIVAYRIVQEALTNVARHAKVDHASLTVWADDDSLYLQVEDAGAGFEPQAVTGAGGVLGMRERALVVGGELEIDSSPGRGTQVRARLPLS